MDITGSSGDEAEITRIKAVYAKRACTVPGNRYTHFNPGNLFIVQERERRLLAVLARYGYEDLDARTILEVGCGTGHWLREFVQWGARPENLAGVDLLPERIAEARHRCPAGVTVQCGSATKLNFPEASFDLVLQSTLFTSILDQDMRRVIASEMLRVMKPDGAVLWYDYHVDNPRNPDVRGVGKREIHRLFPGCRIELRRLTLAPPLARRLAPCSRLLCSLLARIPLLCTHYLGVIRKG